MLGSAIYTLLNQFIKQITHDRFAVHALYVNDWHFTFPKAFDRQFRCQFCNFGVGARGNIAGGYGNSISTGEAVCRFFDDLHDYVLERKRITRVNEKVQHRKDAC